MNMSFFLERTQNDQLGDSEEKFTESEFVLEFRDYAFNQLNG